jgi:hypothetical protein
MSENIPQEEEGIFPIKFSIYGSADQTFLEDSLTSKVLSSITRFLYDQLLSLGVTTLYSRMIILHDSNVLLSD